MSEPSLIGREVAVLHDLEHLVAERSTAERRAEEGRSARKEAMEREFQEASRKVAAWICTIASTSAAYPPAIATATGTPIE